MSDRSFSNIRDLGSLFLAIQNDSRLGFSLASFVRQTISSREQRMSEVCVRGRLCAPPDHWHRNLSQHPPCAALGSAVGNLQALFFKTCFYFLSDNFQLFIINRKNVVGRIQTHKRNSSVLVYLRRSLLAFRRKKKISSESVTKRPFRCCPRFLFSMNDPMHVLRRILQPAPADRRLAAGRRLQITILSLR